MTLELISLIPLVVSPEENPLAVKLLDNRLCINIFFCSSEKLSCFFILMVPHGPLTYCALIFVRFRTIECISWCSAFCRWHHSFFGMSIPPLQGKLSNHKVIAPYQLWSVWHRAAWFYTRPASSWSLATSIQRQYTLRSYFDLAEAGFEPRTFQSAPSCSTFWYNLSRLHSNPLLWENELKKIMSKIWDTSLKR